VKKSTTLFPTLHRSLNSIPPPVAERRNAALTVVCNVSKSVSASISEIDLILFAINFLYS
jgi:hypothetical protein